MLRFCFLFLFFVCINLPNVYANKVDSIQQKIDAYLKDIQYNYCFHNLDSTYYHLDIVENIALDAELWQTYIEIPLWKAYCAREWKELQLIEIHLREGEERLLTYRDKLDPQKWEELWVDFQIRMGDFYRKAGLLPKALTIFENLISNLRAKDTLSDALHQSFVICHIHTGAIHTLNQNYELALDAYQYCIDYEREVARRQNRPASYQTSFARLASVYLLKKEYSKAIDNYKKTLNYYHQYTRERPEYINLLRAYILPIYSDISKSFHATNELDSAFRYANLALNYQGITQSQKANTYLLLGDITPSNGKSTAVYFQDAITLLSNLYRRKHYEIARAYIKLGDYYVNTKQLELAKESYQTAIIQLVEEFNNTDFDSNPILAQINSKKDLWRALYKKAALQYRLYETTKDSTMLSQSHQTSQLAINLIESIRIESQNKEDKQQLVEDSYSLFELALDITYEMGEASWEIAFQTIEKSKAMFLFEHIQKVSANTFATMPKEVLNKENILSYQISELEQSLYNNNFDEERIMITQNRIFELKKDLKDHIANIEKKSSKYYQLKYNFSPVSIQDLQAFLQNQQQSVIEYFSGKEHIYKIIITPNKLYLERVKNTESLQAAMVSLKDDIYNKDNDSYLTKARKLYQTLLPNDKTILLNRLVIIPDGNLHHIPFGVLLTSEVKSENNFKTYPFLIKQYALSYFYSATILTKLYDAKKEAYLQNEVLAFAPSYKEKPPSLVLLDAEREEERGHLYQLKYNQSEVLDISNLVVSEVITSQATKAVFLDKMAQYDFIHIASHALEDSENPDYSYIAFSNVLDTINNFKLYVRELYEHQLSTKLVVLSACETGTGKAYLGEGVISIARGFIYAGAKSVVTTLWNINDKSTQTLMQSFYKKLSKNMDKDKAIQQAKLAYLEEVDNFSAHPKYWAAFVALGNMEAVDIPQTNGHIFSWVLMALAFLIAFIVFIKSLSKIIRY